MRCEQLWQRRGGENNPSWPGRVEIRREKRLEMLSKNKWPFTKTRKAEETLEGKTVEQRHNCVVMHSLLGEQRKGDLAWLDAAECMCC